MVLLGHIILDLCQVTTVRILRLRLTITTSEACLLHDTHDLIARTLEDLAIHLRLPCLVMNGLSAVTVTVHTDAVTVLLSRLRPLTIHTVVMRMARLTPHLTTAVTQISTNTHESMSNPGPIALARSDTVILACTASSTAPTPSRIRTATSEPILEARSVN